MGNTTKTTTTTVHFSRWHTKKDKTNRISFKHAEENIIFSAIALTAYRKACWLYLRAIITHTHKISSVKHELSPEHTNYI